VTSHHVENSAAMLES